MSLTDGHVTTIAVDPAWHRHGIGTRLLLALAREAIARGATALTLEVRLSNQGAQELYRRFGFTAVGVRKGYYADTGEDALVMWAYEVERTGVRARLLDGIERAHSAARPCIERPKTLVGTVRILGIETSCDETAAAVVDDGRVRALVGGRRARPICTRASAASCPRSRAARTSS